MITNQPRRVLIVDDDESAGLAAQLGIALATDWEARVVTSGDEALERCRIWQPGAVLLDTEMPDRDGFATLAALRREPSIRHIPVVLVADPATSNAAIAALAPTLAGVLDKPLDMSSVGPRLTHLLDWPAYN